MICLSNRFYLRRCPTDLDSMILHCLHPLDHVMFRRMLFYHRYRHQHRIRFDVYNHFQLLNCKYSMQLVIVTFRHHMQIMVYCHFYQRRTHSNEVVIPVFYHVLYHLYQYRPMKNIEYHHRLYC